MIKIYLLDKKSNLEPETNKEYVYLPNSFLEIRKEAVKIYKWLKAIEQRYGEKLDDQKYSFRINIINQ